MGLVLIEIKVRNAELGCQVQATREKAEGKGWCGKGVISM